MKWTSARSQLTVASIVGTFLLSLSVIRGFTPNDNEHPDAVTALPGWEGPLPSRQYSGFLSAGGTKNLHYWFVESERSPETDPVVLWLNGGPGCSSLIGYLNMHGQLLMTNKSPSRLLYNNWTWTKLANMIYLESPAGVGFSYAETSEELSTDDYATAEGNLKALEDFFQRFPQFARMSFISLARAMQWDATSPVLSFESSIQWLVRNAGVYVPTLAEAIMDAKVAGISEINLKGLAVGNGCTGSEVGICQENFYKGLLPVYEYLKDHGMLSEKHYRDLLDVCYDDNLIPLELNDSNDNTCIQTLNTLSEKLGYFDLYDISAECIQTEVTVSRNQERHERATWTSHYSLDLQWRRIFDRPATSKNLRSLGSKSNDSAEEDVSTSDQGNYTYITCKQDTAAKDWLNRRDVMESLNVGRRIFAQQKQLKWEQCFSFQANNATYKKSAPNLPRDVYPKLIAADYRILIFAGDQDACVPYTDSERWTSGNVTNLVETESWRPWNVDKQLAGYVTTYNDGAFSFVTVKGAGHKVATGRPKLGYEMFKRFLERSRF